MTEIARIYLGNLNEQTNLLETLAIESCLQLQLTLEDRHKGRIYGHTKEGVEVGIVKNRDRSLRSGDLFKTNSHKIVRIELKEQELLVLDLSGLDHNICSTKLVQLGHALGNNHYPIKICDRQIFIKLVTDKKNAEKLINDLNISDLQISYQYMSSEAGIAWTEHSH